MNTIPISLPCFSFPISKDFGAGKSDIYVFDHLFYKWCQVQKCLLIFFIYFFLTYFILLPLIVTGFNLAPSPLSSSQLRTGKYGICELSTSSQWGISLSQLKDWWNLSFQLKQKDKKLWVQGWGIIYSFVNKNFIILLVKIVGIWTITHIWICFDAIV